MAASSLIDFLIHTHGVVRAKYCGRAASERAMIYEQRETQKVSPHTVHNFNQVQRAHSLARSWLLFVRFLHRSVRKSWMLLYIARGHYATTSSTRNTKRCRAIDCLSANMNFYCSNIYVRCCSCLSFAIAAFIMLIESWR